MRSVKELEEMATEIGELVMQKDKMRINIHEEKVKALEGKIRACDYEGKWDAIRKLLRSCRYSSCYDVSYGFSFSNRGYRSNNIPYQIRLQLKDGEIIYDGCRTAKDKRFILENFMRDIEDYGAYAESIYRKVKEKTSKSIMEMRTV